MTATTATSKTTAATSKRLDDAVDRDPSAPNAPGEVNARDESKTLSKRSISIMEDDEANTCCVAVEGTVVWTAILEQQARQRSFSAEFRPNFDRIWLISAGFLAPSRCVLVSVARLLLHLPRSLQVCVMDGAFSCASLNPKLRNIYYDSVCDDIFMTSM